MLNKMFGRCPKSYTVGNHDQPLTSMNDKKSLRARTLHQTACLTEENAVINSMSANYLKSHQASDCLLQVSLAELNTMYCPTVIWDKAGSFQTILLCTHSSMSFCSLLGMVIFIVSLGCLLPDNIDMKLPAKI